MVNHTAIRTGGDGSSDNITTASECSVSDSNNNNSSSDSDNDLDIEYSCIVRVLAANKQTVRRKRSSS
ncbi:hypothetical protein ElyMa_000091900 [Elysia marginata]|uniref:Uncharacterized protein n=1 Tax=Elysia marginata TaxID=1093978 RepID=A0AAV4EKF0_9GAST|nr:hypothetical protein ElyMa_000091900 [Elysia marginata]